MHAQLTNKCNYTGDTYPIKSRVDCSSTFVIYLLSCPCNLQYIGRTTQLFRVRVNQHRHNCTRGYTKRSVSRHAAIHRANRFDKFNISIIEHIPTNIPDRFERLAKREMFWIYKFYTLHLHGLNESLESVY